MGARRLLRRGFDFRVRIEPAQVFTLFFFLLDFRPTGLGATSTLGIAFEDSATFSVDDVTEMIDLGCVSEELELSGRERVGELLPTNGSRPKKDHLFGVLEGLGVVVGGAWGSGGGSDMSSGIELRLLGDEAGPS